MNTTVAMFAPGENLQRTSARKAMSKPAPLRARPIRRSLPKDAPKKQCRSPLRLPKSAYPHPAGGYVLQHITEPDVRGRRLRVRGHAKADVDPKRIAEVIVAVAMQLADSTGSFPEPASAHPLDGKHSRRSGRPRRSASRSKPGTGPTRTTSSRQQRRRQSRSDSAT
jgi:hypothetical protein